MNFRFHKRLRLLKFLHVNLSTSGASLSVGRRGATVGRTSAAQETNQNQKQHQNHYRKNRGTVHLLFTPRKGASNAQDRHARRPKTVVKNSDLYFATPDRSACLVSEKKTEAKAIENMAIIAVGSIIKISVSPPWIRPI